MFDSATFSHATRVLGETHTGLPADAALRRYLKLASRLGPREKRAVSRAVFTYFRWLQWLDPKQSVQKQLERAAELQDRFDRDPKSVKPEALAARAVPAWFHDEVAAPPGYFAQLQHEPALWLRARPGTAAKLAGRLGNCVPAPAVMISSSGFPVPTPASASASPAKAGEPAASTEIAERAPSPASGIPVPGVPPANAKTETPNSQPRPALETPDLRVEVRAPDALRFTGLQDLFVTAPFHEGAFEIQDLASQLVGIATGAQPRETWWDACAGEGGKLLHVADLMDNKGLIWATDRSVRRLEQLKRRAARAHLFNFRAALWEGGPRLPTKTRFDGVLVDAPCSGVATWQRNPHARWTTSPDDVRELAATQLALLSQVAGTLKPGGRLVYAVCTLTRSETAGVADAFQAAHPEFEPLPLFGVTPRVTLWPQELNANGMFLAGWRRT